jgi:hypothetical protein
MDSTDLCPDAPTDEDVRNWVRAKIDDLNMTPSDAEDFFECYIDPEGWFRYGPDVYDALDYIARFDPRTLADALVQDEKENR